MDHVGEAVRIESTFHRIAAGSRVVAALWMGALAVVVLVRGVERPAIVVAALVVGLLWAALALWVFASRPARALDPPMLALDGIVAVASVIAAAAAGSTISFFGGLPLIVVGIAALRSRPIALTTASVLAAVQLGTLGVERAGQVVDQLTLIFAYLGIALLVSWIVAVLRASQSELVRANAETTAARAEAARAAERAEISRHLHDSVLQTLALIQRDSDDPAEVTLRARRQERELREWLYGDRRSNEQGFAESLRAAAASVEERFGQAVDVVCVGDADPSRRVEEIVAAAGEAIVNAAIHSGADAVDVFGEAGDDGITVYVRDRGDGFDPDTVPAERRGIAESIIGRMESAGGAADVRTGPGRGTEWRLRIGAKEDRHE